MEQTPPVHSDAPPVLAAPAVTAPVAAPEVAAPNEAKAPRRVGLSNVLSFVVGLVGVAALGASAWVYAETQRDIGRMNTDIAQFRLSLELFGRQHPATAPTSDATPSAGSGESLQDLSNRLAILEQSWRSAPPATGAVSLPATPATANATPQTDGDCLPTGTRFLVTSGDNYPVCGTTGAVAIGAVDNGFISLADGTVIAAGGMIALPGTKCMIGVVSAGADGMAGYAEIRVNC